MSVHLEKCTSIFCGRLYEVEHFSRAFAKELRNGVVECPHCGCTVSGNNRLVYRTRSLPSALENWPEVAEDSITAHQGKVQLQLP